MRFVTLIAAWLTLGLPPKSVPQRPVPQQAGHHLVLLKKQAHARHLRHLRELRRRRRAKRLRAMRPVRVVRAALSQRGVPYVWGGEAPGSGFDCSGLMQWAYRRVGMWIGRTTYVQRYAGWAVSLARLRMGDLVFSNGGEHVGMYAGGGMVVEAPHTGATVEIVRVSYFGAEFARRLIRR